MSSWGETSNSLDVNCRSFGSSRMPFSVYRICIVRQPMVFFAVGGVKMTLRQRFTWQRTTWQARKYVRNYSWKRDMGRSRLTVAVAHRYTLKEHRMSHKYGYVSTHPVRLDNRFIMDRLRYIIQGRDLSRENGGITGNAGILLETEKFLPSRRYRLRHPGPENNCCRLERSRLPCRIWLWQTQRDLEEPCQCHVSKTKDLPATKRNYICLAARERRLRSGQIAEILDANYKRQFVLILIVTFLSVRSHHRLPQEQNWSWLW